MDSGKTIFKWSAAKILGNFFPNLPRDQKVVLACLPNVILFGFGTVPSEGTVADKGEVFAGMDNGKELGADLAPIHAAILLLIVNDGHSFHLQGNSPPMVGGIDLAMLDAAFGQAVKQGLHAKFAGSIACLDRRSKDGVMVLDAVTSHQTMFVEKWCQEHPSEATAYIKSPPPATPAKRPQDFAGGYSDDEDSPRQHTKIKLQQAIKINMDSAQVDIDVGQAAHNRTKILTNIPKSWAFKTRFDPVTALLGLNAALLIASNTQSAPDDLNLDNDNKPTLCVYNEALIHLLESNNGIKWFNCFRNEFPHIPCSIAHKVGSCYSHNCKSARNFSKCKTHF